MSISHNSQNLELESLSDIWDIVDQKESLPLTSSIPSAQEIDQPIISRNGEIQNIEDKRRNSFTYLVQAAVKQMFPETQFGESGLIKGGSFCDFRTNTNITMNDLQQLEFKLKKLLAEDIGFDLKEVEYQDAITIFETNKQYYKIQQLREMYKIGIPSDEEEVFEDGDSVEQQIKKNCLKTDLAFSELEEYLIKESEYQDGVTLQTLVSDRNGKVIDFGGQYFFTINYDDNDGLQVFDDGSSLDYRSLRYNIISSVDFVGAASVRFIFAVAQSSTTDEEKLKVFSGKEFEIELKKSLLLDSLAELSNGTIAFGDEDFTKSILDLQNSHNESQTKYFTECYKKTKNMYFMYINGVLDVGDDQKKPENLITLLQIINNTNGEILLVDLYKNPIVKNTKYMQLFDFILDGVSRTKWSLVENEDVVGQRLKAIFL